MTGLYFLKFFDTPFHCHPLSIICFIVFMKTLRRYARVIDVTPLAFMNLWAINRR